MIKTKYGIIVVFVISLVLYNCKETMTNQNKTKHKKNYPVKSYAEASKWADSIISQLSIDEKIKLIGGNDIFYTEEIPRLKIPRVLFADATQGIHLRDKFGDVEYERALDSSTAMPAPIMLASTWNKELAYKYSEAIGEECKAGAIPVLLGPGMNIYRISQCGRNFEYFGEDPFLASRMIENYVTGLQNTGTIATLKHFIANNTDYFRRKSNSIVSNRALHEIYLPAFKAGIDAGAMAVMTSYNLVNGEWTGQNDTLINELLRKELGFKWLVMTDWWSVYDGEKVIKSGQDLEMPYRIATSNAKQLLNEGKIEEENLNKMVKNILTTLYSINGFNRKKEPELLKNLPKHNDIALATAREGIVLLKNSNSILPVNISKTKKILVTGPYADKLAKGGGAATVDGYNNITLLEALEKEFGEKIEYIKEPDSIQIKNADKIFLCIGTYDSEGCDRPFNLPDKTEKLVKKIVSANTNTIVIVNSGSGIKMTDWYDKAAAILFGWYPGQNGNIAMAEILSGKTNPSGKLPITIEKDFKDSPGYGYLPEGEQIYTGWNEEKEKLHEVYDINYSEGIFVGYRWYEHKNITPLFPFGFGLSYTTFEYSELKTDKNTYKINDTILITFKLKNSGKRAGFETAQLYISDISSSEVRPLKELKGFEKVFLNAGEEKQISIPVSNKDLAFWSEINKKWTTETGKFDILIGSSSKNINLKKTINLKDK